MAYHDKMSKKPMTKKDYLMRDNKEWGLREDRRDRKRGRPEEAPRDGYRKGPKEAADTRKGYAPREEGFRRGPKGTPERKGFLPREEGFRKGPKGTPETFAPRKSFTPAPRVKVAPEPPRPAPEAEREPENLLSGRNPIREALKSGRELEKLLVAKGELSGSAKEIVAMARENKVPVQVVDRRSLDEITPHHQGMLAFASAYHYHEVEEILALAKEKNEKPFVVILDGIQDPHNLGAIIRSAACAGAHGVIIPQRRAVGLTPAAVKASAGAVEKIMVARVTNLKRTLDYLKDEGLWLYAADMNGEDYRRVDYSGAVGLVIGSEGEGAARLTLESCDRKIRIPMTDAVDSLNASVAAGILLFAIRSSREV